MRIWTVVIIILRNLELGLRDLFHLRYRPYKILLELTDYCNSKCKTCFIWKKGLEKKTEISISDLSETLNQYGPNLLWVALGGGEISLYSDFDRLVDLLIRSCPNLRVVTFTTNGLRPKKALECAIKLKSKGYDVFVTISLDGDRNTHDLVRGVVGNHESAQHTFSILKEAGIWCHFGLTISGYNESYIQNKLKHDISNIRAFSFEHAGGIYKINKKIQGRLISKSISIVQSLYKIKNLSEIIEYIYIVLAKDFFEQNKKTLPIPCDVVASSLHIRPNGDIKPCMYLPAIGNIKTDLLEKVLISGASVDLRKRAGRGECEKCWMNCYAPHSIMRHPILSTLKVISNL